MVGQFEGASRFWTLEEHAQCGGSSALQEGHLGHSPGSAWGLPHALVNVQELVIGRPQSGSCVGAQHQGPVTEGRQPGWSMSTAYICIYECVIMVKYEYMIDQQ